MSDPRLVVLDTNVFVAAGFRRDSASARVLEALRGGALRLVWNDDTLRETRHIVRKIPPLAWHEVEGLFREEDRHEPETDPDSFGFVVDPDDRKFAALAAAAGATLVTLDDHLLDERQRTDVPILTPGELLERLSGGSARSHTASPSA